MQGGSYISNGRQARTRGGYTGSIVTVTTPLGSYVTAAGDDRPAQFGGYVDTEFPGSIEQPVGIR